jgi:hypothetical protein
LCKSTKFIFEFCGLDPIGRPALVDTATLSCFNHNFSTNFHMSPLLFYYNNVITKNFSAICAKEKSVGNSLHIHLIEIVMQTFRWKSLRGWDSRPQLIVVSGLFGGNPFVGGILGHNLLLSRAFFGGNHFVDGIFRSQLVVVSGLFFTMEFRLSRSLSHELFSFFTV